LFFSLNEDIKQDGGSQLPVEEGSLIKNDDPVFFSDWLESSWNEYTLLSKQHVWQRW